MNYYQALLLCHVALSCVMFLDFFVSFSFHIYVHHICIFLPIFLLKIWLLHQQVNLKSIQSNTVVLNAM